MRDAEEYSRIEIDTAPAGERIDKFITRELGDSFSRSKIKELIENGYILVNGKKVKAGYSVKQGDTITKLDMPDTKEDDIVPEDIELDILHEDEHLVVVNKPAGMVVHPGAGNLKGTLTAALIFRFGGLPGHGSGPSRPGIVHRLDKDTSGLIVAARNERTMRSLSKQFQNRTIKKVYTAVVTGNVELDNGVIELPIARKKTDRKKMGVEFSDGRPARTVYHVAERFGNFTLVKLDLHTGRTHQIRVHMSHLGHPVAGDKTYGGRGDIARQALHAEILGFTHPGTSEYAEFRSPIPGDILDFIESIRS